MKHELGPDEYRVELDYSVESNLKSFKEEVLNTLNQHYQNFGIKDQMFSGGMDSTFILRSLQELGLNPQLHTISFSKDNTDYGALLAKAQCKKFGAKEPEFFYLDKDDFLKYVNFVTYEKKIAYPALQGYYMDYYASKMGDKKLFFGMCEYRTTKGIVILNNAIQAVKEGSPNRFYGFESSETFLAFINDPIFKLNYLKDNPSSIFGEYIWRVRDLVYASCYPEIGLISKRPHDSDYIGTPFNVELLPTIKKMYPIVFSRKSFRFNAQEYLNRKEAA
jgi:hypothetical protein